VDAGVWRRVKATQARVAGLSQEDELEVWTYRAAISVVAAAFGVGTLAAQAPGVAPALHDSGNLLALAGGGGMAVATTLIHIYVTPLKRLLQALLAAGVMGAAYLAATQPEPLPAYVAAHPSAVWLVGPAFASLTGICFKEGLCYGKLESALLALLLPAWLLGHLSGLLPEAGERGLAVVIAALLAVFAARKYTQPVKDDIGGKGGASIASNGQLPR
jgi:uncharacterized integral membrane protein